MTSLKLEISPYYTEVGLKGVLHFPSFAWTWNVPEPWRVYDDDDEVLLNVLRCQLTYQGQVVSNAEARLNNSLRPRTPEGSLGRTAQDGHVDSHTAPEL